MCDQCRDIQEEGEHGAACPCACHPREELYAIANEHRRTFDTIESEAEARRELVI